MKKLKTLFLLISLIIPFTFVGCENENKNSLSAPTNLSVQTGNIVFDQVKDAEYYTIAINNTEISLDAKHSNNVQIIDNQINYNASKIFVIGESYSIKVKANATNKKSSDYTSPVSYKHIGSITKPENVQINGTTLTWDVVENASYYLVKIITPNDEYILNKDGSVLTKIDAASIQNADLTEYSFYSNQFNFGSMLSKAGVYNFYVCSVHNEIGSYFESGYTDKVSYNHYIQLSKPVSGVVNEHNGELFLTTVIDSNSKMLSVYCGDNVKNIEIASSGNEIISKIDNEVNNFIKINLSNCFYDIDFNELKQYSFKVQSIATSANDFNINSMVSNTATYEKTYKLSAPTVELTKNIVENFYNISWTCDDANFVSKYKVVLFTSTGLKEYNINADTNSIIIDEDFIGAAVTAEGSGNYISSYLSNIVYPNTVSTQLPNLNITYTGNTVTWNAIADYYIVEHNNNRFVTDTNSFTFNLSDLKTSSFNVKVIAIKNNCIAKLKEITVNAKQKLATPTFSSTQGFNNTKLYELNFTGVDNAIGYYVYIKSETSDYRKINTLFTSTSIDLTNEIISKGEYSEYTVKVQAVADPESVYLNSLNSVEVSVTHAQILSAPSFYTIEDGNGQYISTPIIKSNDGKYILKFSSVDNAEKYEILINNNVKNVLTEDVVPEWYEIDVTNYMIGAGLYNIKIRAIPSSTSTSQPSEYVQATYTLKQQLQTVSGVTISEIDGVYTLSFKPVDNAQSYRIRIIKENDSNYIEYLKSIGLNYSFEVDQAVDVTNYVKQHGVYYFYVKALAPKTNSYYIDANESSTVNSSVLDKLETIETPKNLTFNNVNEKEYVLTWTGDNRADYYKINLINPEGISFEFNVTNATSTNINNYITTQGEYTVSITSMITPTSENSKYYSQSAATTTTHDYSYRQDKDFLRYSVYSFGEYYSFSISNVTQLKNLLWHYYLYPMNNRGLTLKINLATEEVLEEEITLSLRETLIRYAEEANNLGYYNYANDEVWLNLIANEQSSNNELLSHLCQSLLSVYPEYNILSSFNLTSIENEIFNLSYKNELNTTKTKTQDITNIKYNETDYGNDYKYIDPYLRKSTTGVFKIDSKEEMYVTTTEQLLHAVSHNKKPKFIGESSVAENVYKNAKLVLTSIVSDNMTDYQKATAIFDWLEYGFDIAYFTFGNTTKIAGSFEKENISTYGLYEIYYLESIFANISSNQNGDILIGNNLATSKSYSKAFALLCGIEGINSNLVYGEYTYTVSNTPTTVEHIWNVVNIDSSWYSLDLTFSDNRIYFPTFSYGYGISSHSRFLNCKESTYDTLTLEALGITNLVNKNKIVYSNYPSTDNCNTNYSYYSNNRFGLSDTQIKSIIKNASNAETFSYAKTFEKETDYQKYSKTEGYGKWQNYILNLLIYAGYLANTNESGLCTIEFSYAWSENNNVNTFDIVNNLTKPYEDARSYSNYNLQLNLLNDASNQSRIFKIDNESNKSSTIIIIAKKSA